MRLTGAVAVLPPLPQPRIVVSGGGMWAERVCEGGGGRSGVESVVSEDGKCVGEGWEESVWRKGGWRLWGGGGLVVVMNLPSELHIDYQHILFLSKLFWRFLY